MVEMIETLKQYKSKLFKTKFITELLDLSEVETYYTKEEYKGYLKGDIEYLNILKNSKDKMGCLYSICNFNNHRIEFILNCYNHNMEKDIKRIEKVLIKTLKKLK